MMKKKILFIAVGILVLLSLPLLAFKGHLAWSTQEVVMTLVVLATISFAVYF
ncbi:MAG: hypothetical protein M0C28_35590 [Candidatus Moduliflexus flocculans]|jgi:hypothetical protein|nr:hypothetical protein [Candidatus Moduliflexus flocculans]